MKKIALIIMIGAFGFFIANSQTVPPEVYSVVSPQYPSAGETVNISLNAYATDLSLANISWSVNGKQIKSGQGIRNFSVESGNSGEKKNVTAVIYPSNGSSITKTFTISTQEVSIIYEANSYTPPFYKGKGVFAKEGSVRFIALPNLFTSNGVRLNPNNLTYKWSFDGTVQGSNSGYGKNSISYTSSILGPAVRVEVEVSSADGSVVGKGVNIFTPLQTEVMAYENNPLYGILFNKEVSSLGFKMSDSEVTLKAFPFFSSSPKSIYTDLQYSWTINGSSIPVPKEQGHVTLRKTEGQTGKSIIGLSVKNLSHMLQRTNTSLTISF